MKLEILAIKDRAADAYGRPMFLPSTGVGIRSFTDEVNKADKDNNLYMHPDDFDLYHLGTFDDLFAKFEIFEIPLQICIGKQVKIPV